MAPCCATWSAPTPWPSASPRLPTPRARMRAASWRCCSTLRPPARRPRPTPSSRWSAWWQAFSRHRCACTSRSHPRRARRRRRRCSRWAARSRAPRPTMPTFCTRASCASTHSRRRTSSRGRSRSAATGSSPTGSRSRTTNRACWSRAPPARCRRRCYAAPSRHRRTRTRRTRERLADSQPPCAKDLGARWSQCTRDKTASSGALHARRSCPRRGTWRHA
mmetsp:Transcript_11291/g.28557  ORF Transcript_11291/g.28557 Transcript_11291/m.28557 type:complete len:220 (-) Transcript_11291:120-779(-)